MRRLHILMFAALGAAAVGAPLAAHAVGVDGRFTASAYAFEGNPTEGTTTTNLRSHGALRLTLNELGHRGLSLHSYLRATTDLTESADSDPRLRAYNLFVRYRDRRIDARAGRQRVFAGVGYGTIDGARIDVERAGIDLTLYGGALVPVDGSGVNALADAHLWGARLRTSRLAGVDVAVSFADRERDPAAYVPRASLYGYLRQPPAVRRRLLGVEANRRFGLHSLRGRVDYDLHAGSLRRSELAGRLGLSADLAVSTEWRHREPHIYDGSIFSVFPISAYDELGLRCHYRLSPRLSLAANAATVRYDDDSSVRLGLSAAIGRHLTLGYHRAQGYAGDNDGFSGHLNYPLRRNLVLRGQLNLASYESFEADDRDGLAAAVAGLTWRPSRTLSLDGQMQALRNPSSDSDLRLLVRGSWRFRR